MAIEQQIKDLDDQFAGAFNRGDLAALVALHAEDALLLSPDSPAERGSEGVKSGFKELLDAGWKNISFTSVELGSGGDLAYHVGKFAVDVPTSSGESKRVTGKYVNGSRSRWLSAKEQHDPDNDQTNSECVSIALADGFGLRRRKLASKN